MKSQANSSLKDRLNPELLEKMKQAKQEMKAAETKREEEAEAKMQEERRLREKNKSFEELLNESNLNWKSYK